MKTLLAFTCIILCYACNFIPDKKEQKAIRGKWEDRTYTNDLFKMKMTLPEPWDIHSKNKANPFSNTFAQATYYFYQDTLGIPLAEFEAEYDKKNPYDKNENEETRLAEEQDGFAMLYDKNEFLVSPTRKLQLSGKDFYYTSYVLLDGESDSTFIDRYVRLDLAYFIDFTVTYYSQADRKIATDVMQQVQFGK